MVPTDMVFGMEKFNFTDIQEAKSVLFQTNVLHWCHFQQQVRNWDTWLMGMGAAFIIAFCISRGIWRNLGNNQASAAKIPPALFYTCVNQGISASLQRINSFPGESARPVPTPLWPTLPPSRWWTPSG